MGNDLIGDHGLNEVDALEMSPVVLDLEFIEVNLNRFIKLGSKMTTRMKAAEGIVTDDKVGQRAVDDATI